MNERRKQEALVWGAGKIGRGFLAEIFQDADYNLNFIEYDKTLLNKLKEADKYTIYKMIAEDRQEQIDIEDFEAHHSQNKEVITDKICRENSIIAIAVHQKALPEVVKMMVPGIIKKSENDADSTLDVILCINMSHPASYCKQLLQEKLPQAQQKYLQENIGLIESVVMRISPETPQEILEKDELAVLNNGYPEMPVDKTAFKGKIPETDMLHLSEDIEAEEKRKIYTLNMAHVMLAYLGKPRGYVYADECIQDPEIRKVVSGALKEVGVGLVGRYHFSENEMKSWYQDIINFLENPVLKDELSRLGRDSQRKLGYDDRLVGPAQLCLQYGGTPFYLAQGIAYGFKFSQENDPGTEEVQKYLEQYGIEKSIEKFCGLKEGRLFELIKSIYREIVDNKNIVDKDKFLEEEKNED